MNSCCTAFYIRHVNKDVDFCKRKPQKKRIGLGIQLYQQKEERTNKTCFKRLRYCKCFDEAEQCNEIKKDRPN